MTHDKAACSRVLRLVSSAEQNQTQAHAARWEAVSHCCASLDPLLLSAYVVCVCVFIGQMEGGGGRTAVEKEAGKKDGEANAAGSFMRACYLCSGGVLAESYKSVISCLFH